MFCPICGKVIEDKEQFCRYCKADLSEKPTNGESVKVLCPNCNKEIDVGNEEVGFCKFCGSELTEESIDEQTTVIACPYCNKEVDITHGEVKFCKHCGSNINGTDDGKMLPRYCQNCGKEMDEDSEFCRYCGAKFGKASADIGSNKRPTSVSIIGWLVIISCVLAIFVIIGGNTTITYGRAEYAKILIFELAFELVLAIGILKGSNWCRIAFLILQPVSLIIGWLVVKFQPGDMLSIVIIIIVTIILTRPNASKFFRAI